ncbi:hypothetical protein [Candidatus Cyanaurora vandensis]|uniref:hypothetical protein n=1 Tax=Candidatus Cyanaurora vandensis TaxID=2714958 RepID=UPI00257A7566|nr:hypothetical protein [Candidatus Cyanaurora vandensis]
MGNQADRFGDGLAVGVLIGSVIGGVVGALITSQVQRQAKPMAVQETLEEVQKNTEQVLGDARRSLEEKITQLNEAIETARQRLTSLEDVRSPD